MQRQPATAGIDAHNGATQTTDAFYRETTAGINYYTADDVLTIEMKIASLFTIAQYRDIMPGAIFTPFLAWPGLPLR
ncbi:phosphorylase family protein [Halomicrococcus sp. SG-WS-1]|uniref:phosphorylase family protein n=1 Tax=Halomicrococcus sp. SG-WS-1 TaxID=3439057 RepID=UPI003F78DB26